MPVNRLKLYAFAFGAGVAGLTGTLFASLNTAVFSSDFDTPLLITVYAIVILGGAGSLGGVILGALVVNVSLEVLRTPNHATWMFFGLIIAGTRDQAAAVAGARRRWSPATIAFGFAVHAIVAAIWPTSVDGHGGGDGDARRRPRALGPDPGRPARRPATGASSCSSSSSSC